MLLVRTVWRQARKFKDINALPAEIFFVVRQARIIEHHHLDRMAITPEMLVVCFDGCADIA
jgi:hypothetical protein